MSPPECVSEDDRIEVDMGSDQDYDACSVNSAANSIFEYRFENGRRYHAYRDGKYAFPNDEVEQVRLDILHHISLLVLRGELHTAPLCPNPTKILDVGTGTGIWAIDMGEQYPTAEVIGTDLSPIQPTWVPPNVNFLIDDAESEWEWPEGTFDMVHIRYLNGAISDWGTLCKEAYKSLKPGGWIEICEYEMGVCSDDGTYVANSSLGKYYELTNEAARRAGMLFSFPFLCLGFMDKAGFRNSTHKRIKIPLGRWPADPLQREIGECYLMGAETGFEALGMALLTRNLGMDPGDVTKLVDSAKRELWSKKMHVYN
ncbi:S-adenosyl-L-methionine-dependent methyltransferase, partial [Morchella snyderi]